MNIIFFGTSDFACTALTEIDKSKYNIKAVVTNPDKPMGRGKIVKDSAVSKLSLELNYPVVKPFDLKNKLFIQKLKSFNAELFIVVEFKILPESIIDIPAKGTINLHASLLPKYRGASPIQYAIKNGDDFTGVTTFFINKNIDTGNIILQREIPLLKTYNFGKLYKILSSVGSFVLIETIKLIENDTFISVNQNHSIASYAPKININYCKISWKMKGSDIFNHIRSISPKPGAYTYFRKKKIFIYESILTNIQNINKNYGEILINNNNVCVVTGFKMLKVTKLKLEGKNIISDKEFINGYRLKNGECFKEK